MNENLKTKLFEKLEHHYNTNPVLEDNKEFLNDILETLSSNGYNISKTQSLTNLKLFVKDIVYTLNLPENNNDTPPTYTTVNVPTKTLKDGKWIDSIKKVKTLVLPPQRFDDFKQMFVNQLNQNSINMRTSVFQIDKAILNYRIANNFKSTPQEIGKYIKTLLSEGIDTTFLYSPKPYDNFDWDYETADIIASSDILKSSISAQLNKKLFAVDNKTYYAIGNYKTNSFTPDVLSMYQSWSGLKTLINTNNSNVKNLVFLSRSNETNSLKDFLESDITKPKPLSPAVQSLKDELLKQGIYLSLTTRDKFKEEVKKVLGIDETTLNKVLNYSDSNLTYSKNGDKIKFISSKELTGLDKKLMFQIGIVPSASSLTDIILGMSVKNMTLSSDDVIEKVKDLTNNKDKLKDLIIKRVVDKASGLPENFNYQEYEKLSNEEKHKVLQNVGYISNQRNETTKYMSYGTWSEDRTIRHFNYQKDRNFISSEKRTMDISQIFDIPFLTMNYDGQVLTVDENNHRSIEKIIEVKSTKKNLELDTKEDLQKNFLKSYYMQTMLYANVIQPKQVEVLYHINDKNASIKYKNFTIDTSKLFNKDFIPVMKEFYKTWNRTLLEIQHQPVMKESLDKINNHIKLMKPLIVDTKFKTFMEPINDVRDLCREETNRKLELELDYEY